MHTGSVCVSSWNSCVCVHDCIIPCAALCRWCSQFCCVGPVLNRCHGRWYCPRAEQEQITGRHTHQRTHTKTHTHAANITFRLQMAPIRGRCLDLQDVNTKRVILNRAEEQRNTGRTATRWWMCSCVCFRENFRHRLWDYGRLMCCRWTF